MKKETPLYNSRLISVYLRLLRSRYPDVRISEILAYADMEPYEITDEGCWFTQSQVDRFYEKTVQLTGNQNIAREAGRLAVVPGAIGALSQYTFGLLGPSLAFQLINRLSRGLTRSGEYKSRSLRHNQVEVTVTPNEGVEEKPYQCENRMGFFEAIVDGFQLGLPQIEQTECIFKGGECCRYQLTWKRTFSSLFSSARKVVFFALILLLSLGSFALPYKSFLHASVIAIFTYISVSLVSEILRRREMARSMEYLLNNSERLTELIETSSRNVQLVNEIGQALTNKSSVEDVLYTVSEVMETGLDFDCGAILLANKDKTRLEIRSSFGYSYEEIGNLLSTVFTLDNPNSQGPFVQAFHQQKNFVINNTEEIEEKLSDKSRKFVKDLGVHSFLCCPIVIENESLGVIAVTNQTSKRPLVRNDINLLQGIAPSIGVAIQNASLIEELQSSFEKTLRVLADSIDARDYLTAGHSEVVTEYAAGIAEKMNQSEEFVQMIRIAGLLHDYGKIGVPDAILKKDGRLTPEERDIINTHPVKTQQILSKVPFKGVQVQIPEITGAHHERWDGDGYPNGLKGNDIPLGARILAVADFFEAITSKRHYRDPMPLQKALALTREASGSHFDPDVVDAFFEYMEYRDFALVKPSFQDYGNQVPTGSRRKSPRVDYRTQLSARHGQRIISGDIINIGVKGAYIASSDPVEVKDSLTLTFALPGCNDYIQVPAEVCWTNRDADGTNQTHPEGFAVSFKQMPQNALKMMNQFVRRHITTVTETTDEEDTRNAL